MTPNEGWTDFDWAILLWLFQQVNQSSNDWLDQGKVMYRIGTQVADHGCQSY